MLASQVIWLDLDLLPWNRRMHSLALTLNLTRSLKSFNHLLPHFFLRVRVPSTNKTIELWFIIPCLQQATTVWNAQTLVKTSESSPHSTFDCSRVLICTHHFAKTSRSRMYSQPSHHAITIHQKSDRSLRDSWGFVLPTKKHRLFLHP